MRSNVFPTGFRPRSPWRVGLPLLLSLTFLLGGRAPSATAQAGSPPGTAATPNTPAPDPAKEPVINSWALSPTGTDPGQPGTRPNFSYTLDPGAKLDDSVTIWNYSNVPLTFHVYGTDAFTTATGGFDLLKPEDPPKDVGSWIKLAQEFVTVPASTSLVLPFTLTVPADATPGDHAAGILASSQTPGKDADGHFVVLDRRTGSRFFVRVSGPLNPSVTVEGVDSEYHPSFSPFSGGELDVSYTLRNTGNVRLAVPDTISVQGPLGWSLGEQRPTPTPELLPGASIVATAHFTNIAPAFRVSTDVAVAPTAAEKVTPEPEGMTRSSTVWAVPWTLLLILLLLVVVISVARRVRRRRRGASGREGTAVPGADPSPSDGASAKVAGGARPADAGDSSDFQPESVEDELVGDESDGDESVADESVPVGRSDDASTSTATTS